MTFIGYHGNGGLNPAAAGGKGKRNILPQHKRQIIAKKHHSTAEFLESLGVAPVSAKPDYDRKNANDVAKNNWKDPASRNFPNRRYEDRKYNFPVEHPSTFGGSRDDMLLRYQR